LSSASVEINGVNAAAFKKSTIDTVNTEENHVIIIACAASQKKYFDSKNNANMLEDMIMEELEENTQMIADNTNGYFFNMIVQDEIHKEKIEKRDQLLAEMIPLLTEFRAELEADRILYFEYHNSKENLIGIPFKYVDLVLQNNRYGVQPIPSPIYRDISAGVLTDLYEVIKTGKTVYCEGDDIEFQKEHPGAY
jgi:hypothetical protein